MVEKGGNLDFPRTLLINLQFFIGSHFIVYKYNEAVGDLAEAEAPSEQDQQRDGEAKNETGEAGEGERLLPAREEEPAADPAVQDPAHLQFIVVREGAEF